MTAVIGALVTLNADAIRSWLSERDPITYTVSEVKTEPDEGWSLVVADEDRLPAEVAQANDCRELWAIGRRAGGVLSAFAQQRVLLHGGAEEGVTIVDLRARVTGRSRPDRNAAALSCDGAGAEDPIGLSFDLSERTVAPAKRLKDNPANSGDFINQFRDGFVINIAEKESVPLRTETHLPSDAVTWHFEADVVIDGSRKTIVLDDHGSDFRSPGYLPSNQYAEGHEAGVTTADWGIAEAEQVGRNGDIWLKSGPVLVPALPGLDFYRPHPVYPEMSESSRFRWVRHEGRKIVGYNSAGTRSLAFPKKGDLCADTDFHGNDVVDGYGYVSSLGKGNVWDELHGDKRFRRWSIEVRCDTTEGARPAKTLTFLAARRARSTVVFASISNETAPQDAAILAQVFGSLRDNS